MLNRRLRRTIEKNRNELQGILLRRYPRFVLSDRVKDLAEVPVFVFHEIAQESLESVLHFLIGNDYVTLTADEYVARRIGGKRTYGREIVLTFDDGHKTLYTVAYPALKRCGFKAVAYIVPGKISEEESRGAESTPNDLLCDWTEIAEMHESETMDIQSHSMFHHSIPISDQLVDFVRPGMTFSFLDSDLVPLLDQDQVHCTVDESLYGTPICEWGSRFDAKPAFQEELAVVMACRSYVLENGGSAYFRTPDWRRCLDGAYRNARRKVTSGTFETPDEHRTAIYRDFCDSKSEIERRLTQKTVRHFCYPWFRGSPLAATVSAEAGYITNAWGSLLPRFAHNINMPLPVPRLSADYIWRLPGEGRQPLSKVLARKWAAAAHNYW